MKRMPASLKMVYLALCLLTLSLTARAQWPQQQQRRGWPQQPQYVNMLEGARWPVNSDGSTTINVCWENPQGYENGVQWVKDAVEYTWQAEANLQFTGWGACNRYSRGIRVLIEDSHPHTEGLGTQIDGVYAGMKLNFTFRNFRCGYTTENCVKFIAVHEFGHALGIAHEQNRQDCLCGESPQGADGGLYVTSCDLDSVMNYCNRRWNNYGVLSEGDKKGVRIVYGERLRLPRLSNYQPQSLISVSDALGTGQVWENIYVEVGNTGQLFQINGSTPNQTRAWNFYASGNYTYRIWSYTMHTELIGGRYYQVPRQGYGTGTLYLQAGKTYSLSANLVSWNAAGYWNLALK
jgi:Astacin (Peptidase family M12A)